MFTGERGASLFGAATLDARLMRPPPVRPIRLTWDMREPSSTRAPSSSSRANSDMGFDRQSAAYRPGIAQTGYRNSGTRTGPADAYLFSRARRLDSCDVRKRVSEDGGGILDDERSA